MPPNTRKRARIDVGIELADPLSVDVFSLSLKEIRGLLETNGVPFDPKIKDKRGFKVVLDAFLEEQAEFKIVSKENLLLYDVDKLKRFLTYWQLVFSAKARSLEKLQALALTK